jgi:Domain of unknown function (DUF4340)
VAPALTKPAAKMPAFWKTYLVVAVCAALIAYVFLVERKREDKPEAPKEKVLALDKSKVKELDLATVGRPAVHLTREGGDAWRMTSPFAVAADSGEVEAMVSSLESLEVQEVVTETPGKLGEYGLDPPKSTVSVLVQGAAEPLKLMLGEKTPDGAAVYAKVPSRARVFTLPAYAESSFDKKPFDLRDRDVLHVKRDAVKSIEVQGPEGAYALARDDEGNWGFVRPLKTRAGRWSVDGLLGTLEGLRMESVAAEQTKDLKAFGLDKPARVVSLGLADGGTKTLQIGANAGEKKIHAREAGSGLVAVVPGAVVDDLAKGMGELRAKRLLDVSTYDVDGFTVEEQGGKRAYARSTIRDKDGVDVYKWKRTTPDGKDVDTNKVQDALFQVGAAEVQEFVDKPQAPAAYGCDQPFLKATLRMGPGKPEGWFELCRKDALVYARRAGDEAVMKLDDKKTDELLKAFKQI